MITASERFELQQREWRGSVAKSGARVVNCLRRLERGVGG